MNLARAVLSCFPAQCHKILLRRRVAIGISQNCRVAQIKRNIKIDQTDIAFRRKHNIGRLNVAVDYRRILTVQIIQSAADLHSPSDQFVRAEPVSFLQKLSKRFSRHKTHYSTNIPAGLKEVQHLRQIGMMKFLQDIRLSAAAGNGNGAFPVLLDHNFLMKPPVIRFVYNTACSLSKLLQYLICL